MEREDREEHEYEHAQREGLCFEVRVLVGGITICSCGGWEGRGEGGEAGVEGWGGG